jgi:hypothetical protein
VCVHFGASYGQRRRLIRDDEKQGQARLPGDVVASCTKVEAGRESRENRENRGQGWILFCKRLLRRRHL